MLIVMHTAATEEQIGAVVRKIEVEEGCKQALEAVFKTLLHHLMAGKMRVCELA